MNVSKARDFFSDYYEGTLDAGLKQSFEQALELNPEIRAEWDEFVELMEGLAEFPNEEIEVPVYLSDRIATRLEEVQERQLNATPAWMGWFRNLAFAGLGTAVILGTIFGIQSRGGSISTGSFVNSDQNQEEPKNETTYSFKNGQVVLTFITKDNRALLINQNRYTAQSGTRIQPLVNSNERAAEFVIQVEGSEKVETVIVPGTTRLPVTEGTGSLVELGKALADRYGVPVRVTSSVVAPVKWQLDAIDAYASAKAALQDQPVTVDQRESGFLVIGGR